MAERQARGVLDTSAIIDLPVIDEDRLPRETTITAVTLAELSQGPHLAATPMERGVRLERLQVLGSVYPSPLPFDAAAAHDLPLYTRNAEDFAGLGDAVDIVGL